MSIVIGNIVTYPIVEGPLPDGNNGAFQANVVALKNLKVGRSYRINVNLNIGVVADNVQGWQPAGKYVFSFFGDAIKPKLAFSPVNNNINVIAVVSPQQITSVSNGSILALSFNAIITATQSTHTLVVQFANQTALTPDNPYVFPPPAGAMSFVQVQQVQ